MGDVLPEVDLGTGRTAVTIGAGGERTCAILDNGSLKVRSRRTTRGRMDRWMDI